MVKKLLFAILFISAAIVVYGAYEIFANDRYLMSFRILYHGTGLLLFSIICLQTLDLKKTQKQLFIFIALFFLLYFILGWFEPIMIKMFGQLMFMLFICFTLVVLNQKLLSENKFKTLLQRILYLACFGLIGGLLMPKIEPTLFYISCTLLLIQTAASTVLYYKS